MIFGKRFKELREEKGLRQEDVGKIFHVGKSAVSQWEAGIRTPDPNTIKSIAIFFGCSMDYLMGISNIRHPIQYEYQPTHKEVEDVIRENNIMFNGAPLDDDDKQDVIEFIKIALKAIHKINRERGN